MRKLGIIAVLALMVTALAAVPAFAANPHFQRASAAGPDADGDLAVSFKIAGLGDNEEAVVTANATATAVYACQSNSGNFTSDPKKEQVSGNVSATDTFTSDKNGNIVGTLTLSPPATTLNCPPGQDETLVSISYTNVSVSALGDTQSISGTFSKTFFTL